MDVSTGLSSSSCPGHQDPQRVIRDIYDRLGFQISPQFARALREETERARSYRSTHSYSLEQHGLSREQVLAEYGDIVERFGFAPPAPRVSGEEEVA